MRGAFYFIDNGGIESYLEGVFQGYWTNGKDISDTDYLSSIAEENGVEAFEYLEFISTDGAKQSLINNTQELIDRGGFGSPTFFLDGQDMFFGNDRIQLIEQRI